MITTNDEAYELLQDQICGISKSYHDLKDDVSQSAWLAIFKHLKEHGATSTAQLITIARYAALDEYRQQTSHGFRPQRCCKQPRPERVFPGWLNSGTDDSPEPCKTTPPASTELVEHLRSVATSTAELNLIGAAVDVVAAHDYDQRTVSLGSLSELCRRSGLSRAEVATARRSLATRI